MKSFLTALLLIELLSPHAIAKAYFQTKRQMIEGAEVIAIISISEIRPSEAVGKTWTYRQEASAQAETVLKGELPEEFTLHGSETFICAQCPLSQGRFLAFLKKDGELWAGSNWHLSLRPVTEDEVAWYADEENRYEMKPASLEKVVDEIKRRLADQK